MPDLHGRITTHQTSDAPAHNGRHYEFIKSSIHPAFKSATLQRAHELRLAKTGSGQWLTRATTFKHKPLQDANLKLWTAQNTVDRMLSELQDIYKFAEPLLSAALKKQYGVEEDVKTTYLYLYLPKERPWYTFNIQDGVTTRTVSLLDAALHNFAVSETCEADSDFTSQPDANGRFDIKPIKRKMSIAQFQTLCRELDIGARYTQHLESFLLPDDALAKSVLNKKVTDNQKAAFIAAAHLALMTGDITRESQKLVLAMLDGQRNLKRHGKVMHFAELSMMDAALTGIVLITPNLERTWRVEGLIAYVPNDPEHPLKEYASLPDFMNELTRQLRDNAFIESSQKTYRQYFSQFVDQAQRGHFFAGLQQRLFEVKWHHKEPLDQRPTWREEPVSNPHLQFRVSLITDDFWRYQYQKKLNKILNDAREIAVSTADSDLKARWAWWDNFKKIVSDIFNVVLMVATPFVPGLGELMLVYTAYQLTTEVVESIVDLAEGLWNEAAEHIVGVVLDVLQLAAFAAGAKIGQVFRLKLSPLIEGMKPVERPNGQRRLWHPDLKPYALPDFKLPANSTPDELGLHTHEGKSILPLDDNHYLVKSGQRAGQYRVKHPVRTDAYQPELAHNGRGAWSHEAENPRDWDSPTLMRRLGHSVAELSDSELQQIRTISGTEDAALRQMHIDHAVPAPLLDDSLKRFNLLKEARQASERIRAGQPLPPSSYWFEPLATYLEGWPADKALRVYETSDESGPFRQYGNPDASPAQTLSASLSHVMSGELPDSIIAFLNDEELKALLGRQVPEGQRTQALRNALAEEAKKLRAQVFNQQYQAGEASSDPGVRLLRNHYPELPATAAQKLLGTASAGELQRMTQQQQLPLRLKDLARESAFEALASHAYEGFYDETQLSADTERLALNSLRIFTDTFNNLRIDVHEGSPDGALRCSVGTEDAAIVRTLVRDEFARYEVHTGDKPRDADDFFEAILHALPSDRVRALGYKTGDGLKLKRWLMEKTAAPTERRTVLATPPIRTIADPDNVVLLRGIGNTKLAVPLEAHAGEIYPELTPRELRNFVRSLGPDESQAAVTLRQVDRELYQLRDTLNLWKHQQKQTWGPDKRGFNGGGGQHISDRLIECFQRKPRVFGERSSNHGEGYALDLSSELSRYNLDLWWKELPDIKYYLDQVTTLNLDLTRFSDAPTGLLKDFPNLRQLSARNCQLTQLPEIIGQIHSLKTLRLTGNDIRLTPAAVEQLRNLASLETLRLDDNTALAMLPNVDRMPQLKTLGLSNTGTTTWPDGLFKYKRPRNFFLDLRSNLLTEIPTVTPGSEEAWLVARSRLATVELSEDIRPIYANYRKSAGLNPDEPFSMDVDMAMDQWTAQDDSEWWSEGTAGLGAFREEAWQDVMSEPGSEGFFQLIQKQTLSADYRAGGEPLRQLSARVWRMIDAMDLDSHLRQELFDMATSPTTCADAGAQVFNQMGIKVLVTEAYALSTSPEILETKLVMLARGAARLERVDDIARADYRSRKGTPDEVEVYLAYESGLAERLDLPWQSEQMHSRGVAGVSDDTLDTAYDTVIYLEEGDGLINAMIEQPFWDKYLANTYPDQFSRNARRFERRSALLDELREAQQAWAASKEMPMGPRRALKERVQTLTTQLGIDEHLIFTDEVMTDEVYGRFLIDLGYERNELNRLLTRTALQNAEQ